jgi:hypothetical protein
MCLGVPYAFTYIVIWYFHVLSSASPKTRVAIAAVGLGVAGLFGYGIYEFYLLTQCWKRGEWHC